jgi:hypothetical protein
MRRRGTAAGPFMDLKTRSQKMANGASISRIFKVFKLGGEGRNRLKPTAITSEIIDKSPNRIKLFAKIRSLLAHYPFTTLLVSVLVSAPPFWKQKNALKRSDA